MKNNKSIRTLAVWFFMLAILVALYQAFSTGKPLKETDFSDFIAQALPPTYAQSTGSAPMSEVVVSVAKQQGLAVITYKLRESQDSAATAEELAQGKVVNYWTQGDLNTTLGIADGGESVFNALASRGISVTYKDLNEADVASGSEIPFSAFVNQVIAIKPKTNVKKITVQGKEIKGVFADSGVEFTTVGEIAPYRQALVSRGITVTEEPPREGSIWVSILGTVLPMLLIFGLIFFVLRQMQAGSGKAMNFGKSKARLLHESANKVTFRDIAGIEEAKEELQEIVEFLKDPKKFTRLGGRIPKGVLLMGPPGTGKTLLAKGVAGEAGVPFYSISGSDFVEMFVGVGASRVRDLFEQGKKNAPCIIFIDEIDAVGRHRGAGLGGGHDEREQTLNQLLVEMDGFESNDGVILVAATNRPDVLDPALLRPGRFDRRVVVNRPDVKGRYEILKVHTRKARVGNDVDLHVIARGTPGFSGADLANLVNEAALFAARYGKNDIGMADFEEAKDKVLMGSERKSAVLSDEEKKVTAYHEAGHAIVALKVKGNDPLHKVTIIPRGMALGVTWTLPKDDQYSMSKEQVLARIAMAMGGRVAEELTFEAVTTGAGNDFEQATQLARKMVCEWGMSRLGPVALTKSGGSVFLGRDFGHNSDFSEQTQSEADAEVRRILNEQYALATQVLSDNSLYLERLAVALLQLETLDGDEVGMLMEDQSIEDILALREQKAKRKEASHFPPTQERDDLDAGQKSLLAGDALGST